MENPIVSRRWLLVLATAVIVFILALWPHRPGQAQGPMQQDRFDMWNPHWMNRDRWGLGNGMMGPEHQQRMQRHWTFMHAGVPQAYRGKSNPHAITPNFIQAGSSLYAKQCASCHGAQGMGDGEAGRGLSPSPALLAYMIQMPMSVDEYMLWTISDGGQEFETAMPAFKDTLSQKEIWQIVAFMRSGFSEIKSEQLENK